MKRWSIAAVAFVAVLFAFPGVRHAAYAAGQGIRAAFFSYYATSASNPCPSGKQCTYPDSNATPNLHYYDGTTDNKVPACVPTTTGDVCSWNATSGTWQRGTGGGGGSSTLATAYSTGASQTDETITEDATRLGPIIKGYASQSTALLTLQQGSTPGANEDPLTVKDSGNNTVARLEVGGLFWANGQTGGYTADTLGGGATKYVAWIGTNTTAATVGVPVQEGAGWELNSNVWDTGATASKSSSWNVYSTPVSGNPAYGQMEIVHSLNGAAGTNGVLFSTGTSAPSIATGIAAYGLASSTPTVYVPSAVAQAQTAGLWLKNGTTATTGAAGQQWSPGEQQTGQQYNGTTSVAVDWMKQVRPNTGTTVAGDLVFFDQYNGTGWKEMLSFRDGGYIYGTNGSGGAATSAKIRLNDAVGAFFQFSNNYVGINTSVVGINFQVSGSDRVYITSTEMYPTTDNSITFGDATHRPSTAYAVAYAYGAGTAFASLGTPSNGTMMYCSDCTVANPCASGGTGAIAKRLNGAWVCN